MPKSVPNNNSNNSGSNSYKTISQIQPVLANASTTDAEEAIPTFQGNLTNNFANTNSQTIAQLCSNLNTLQPIRFISSNHHHQPCQLAQCSRQNSQSVQLQQITLNSSMLSGGSSVSTGQHQITTGQRKNLGNNLNLISAVTSMPQSSSSPSASPLKPNIIRKSSRFV